MTPTVTSTGRALAERRERILHRVLVATAVLAGIAYVPGMWAAYGEELWGLMVADTLAYGVILVFAFVRRIPYAVRAGGFVAVVYILALVLMVQLGPMGAGTVWLAAGPVLAAVFFRTRGALTALSLTTLILVALGIMIHLDPGLVGGRLPEVEYTLVAWLANAGSILFLTAVLSLSVAALVRWLEGTLSQSTQAAEELRGANLALEREAAERQRLQDRLLQSQKMEALGTLAGGIAHDFNNLLVPILANARDLQSRLSEGAPERDELDEVLDSAGRARELVQQVLAFSRSSSRKRNATAVDPVVEEVGTLLRRTRPPGIELDVHLEAGDARVYANSGELHQVLMNLATNGLLAMESDSGTLLLATALDRDEGVVTLQVSDTGRGMSAEVTERAFDPFFTTREPGQGTGLGLATVHGIVTGLGGRVELESQPGEGTTVRVHLPELRATEAEEKPAAPPEARIETHDPATVTSWEGTSANAPRILVVDDEETVRRVIGRMLEREGYRVVEAADGAAALETLAQDLDGVDLVITDHAMPKMTGIELATQMKDIRPDLPILLTSGFLDPSLLQGAREAGVFATLDKPYENDELTQLVRRGLEASAR